MSEKLISLLQNYQQDSYVKVKSHSLTKDKTFFIFISLLIFVKLGIKINNRCQIETVGLTRYQRYGTETRRQYYQKFRLFGVDSNGKEEENRARRRFLSMRLDDRLTHYFSLAIYPFV